MLTFKEVLRIYRSEGVEPLIPELEHLTRRAIHDGTITKGFRLLCADLCMDAKRFEAAIAILKVQEAGSGLSDVGYNNLGYCYWECEDYELAYRAFDKSLELNPENISSLRGAAYCAIETNRTDQSVELCGAFYEKANKTPEAALWYVTSLYNARKTTELKKILVERRAECGCEPRLEGFDEASKDPEP